jgi:predicted lipid-binding transport protein (Tim44 family)
VFDATPLRFARSPRHHGKVIGAPYHRAHRLDRFEGQRMKALLLALIVAVASIGLAPTNADARRIGGGGSAGIQRSLPARATPEALPARPAPATPAVAPATAGAAPAAAAPKRSWMGPLAGLAAGLGIAALMSHVGLGAEFGNILTIVLFGLVAIVAIRFLMRRFGPQQPSIGAPQGLRFAGAGLPTPPGATGAVWGQPALPADVAQAEGGTTATSLPAGFDTAGFERTAKMIFIRMQAANDTADLDDLRAFTTPEMFATIRLDLQERAGKTQQTDVVKIDAQVLDVAAEADRQLVSVRFHGLIREDKDGVAMPFDEVWHLARPADGSREWAIAGIQQMA